MSDLSRFKFDESARVITGYDGNEKHVIIPSIITAIP